MRRLAQNREAARKSRLRKKVSQIMKNIEDDEQKEQNIPPKT